MRSLNLNLISSLNADRIEPEAAVHLIFTTEIDCFIRLCTSIRRANRKMARVGSGKDSLPHHKRQTSGTGPPPSCLCLLPFLVAFLVVTASPSLRPEAASPVPASLWGSMRDRIYSTVYCINYSRTFYLIKPIKLSRNLSR